MTDPQLHTSELAQPDRGPLLRSYPCNSAEASARIVAVETATLDALRGHERLGLTRPQWHGVIQDLCDDLLGPARCGDESCISDKLLEPMLYGSGEVHGHAS